MPPLNHLSGSVVRAVMGKALIIGKVTAFQNLPASFSLSLSLGPSPSRGYRPQSHPPKEKPAVAELISGLSAAGWSQKTPGSRMRDWGSYSSPRWVGSISRRCHHFEKQKCLSFSPSTIYIYIFFFLRKKVVNQPADNVLFKCVTKCFCWLFTWPGTAVSASFPQNTAPKQNSRNITKILLQ